MKNILFLLFIISFICCGCGNKELTRLDCVEFGLCREGLQTYIEDKEITVTKEFCLQNNYRWYEDTRACFFR